MTANQPPAINSDHNTAARPVRSGHGSHPPTGRGPDKAPFAEERHARILHLLGERGRVRNTELAELLGVTKPTIRKDIADLARQRLLHRTHGGAIATRLTAEPDLPSRMSRNADAKTRIAHACLSLVAPGDAVYLDAGSTIHRIAELMAEDARTGTASRNVNVLTNALGVAQTLAACPDVRHTLLGGTYRPAGGCLVGPLTVAGLDRFTVNIAFLGVTGLADQSFTVADLTEAQVKQVVLGRAKRVVVAMDHTKLGAADFALVCTLDDIGTIVTDEPNEYLTEICHQTGVELVVAGP
jgi:DeoR/GlpR family transcriptional regulator of sugar metabolism